MKEGDTYNKIGCFPCLHFQDNQYNMWHVYLKVVLNKFDGFEHKQNTPPNYY